jgi:hypothetical protein
MVSMDLPLHEMGVVLVMDDMVEFLEKAVAIIEVACSFGLLLIVAAAFGFLLLAILMTII